MQDGTTPRQSRVSIPVKGESRNEKNSMPLLISMALWFGPARPRCISSTSFGTFRGRAEPIFGDCCQPSCQHSVLFAASIDKIHQTRRGKFPYKLRNRAGETLTSYRYLQWPGRYRECQRHWLYARPLCYVAGRCHSACWHSMSVEGWLLRQLWR